MGRQFSTLSGRAPFRSVRRPFVLLPPPLFPSFHLPRKGIRDSKIRGGEGERVSSLASLGKRGVEVKDRVRLEGRGARGL